MKNKKNISIIILSGFFLTLSFFVFSFKNVSATVVYEQLNIGTTEFVQDVVWQELGQGTGQVIDSGAVYLNGTSTPAHTQSLILDICLHGTFTSNYSNSCNGTPVAITGNVETVPANYVGWFGFTLTSATTTKAIHSYAFRLGDGGTPSPNFPIKGSVNNVYTNGVCGDNNGVSAGACTQIQDLAFSIGSSITSSSNKLTLNLPLNNYIGGNFPYFASTFDYATTSTEKIIRLEYSIATSTQSLFNYTHQPFNNTFAGDFCLTPCTLFGSTTIIHGNSTLDIGDYVVQSRIIATNYNLDLLQIIATSTVHNISITDTQNPLYDPFTQNFINQNLATTTGSFFDQCLQLGVNSWQAGVCNLFAFFFIPHDASMNFLKDTLVLFQDVFPFSVFFDFNNFVQNSLKTVPNAKNLSITLKFPTGTTSVQLLTSTILTDTVGADTKNYIFELQKYVMWLGLGFIIVKSIRK